MPSTKRELAERVKTLETAIEAIYDLAAEALDIGDVEDGEDEA